MHIEHSYIYNISCLLTHSLILFLSSLSWNVLYVICMQLHAVFGDTTNTQQCSKTRVNKITKTSTLTTIWCKNKLKLFSSTVNLSAQRKSVHRQEQNPQLPGKYFIDNHRAPKKTSPNLPARRDIWSHDIGPSQWIHTLYFFTCTTITKPRASVYEQLRFGPGKIPFRRSRIWRAFPLSEYTYGLWDGPGVWRLFHRCHMGRVSRLCVSSRGSGGCRTWRNGDHRIYRCTPSFAFCVSFLFALMWIHILVDV